MFRHYHPLPITHTPPSFVPFAATSLQPYTLFLLNAR